MEQIIFEIPGDPVAQGRPRAGKSRGFKHYVRIVATQHALAELIEGPIRLNVDFYRSVPKKFQTKPKLKLIEKGLLLPITKPDCSNYIKGIEYASNGVVWKDDSQIVSMNVRKFYSMSPCVVCISLTKRKKEPSTWAMRRDRCAYKMLKFRRQEN